MLPLLVALARVSPAAASEMCIQVDYSMSLPYADLVFAGTLLKNEADVRLTFQPDRIWKGSPPSRQIVVYELGMPSADSVGPPQGQRYVISQRCCRLKTETGMASAPTKPPSAWVVHVDERR